ncbi:translation elongation factor Ts [Candidatus Peribacteria bacterium RIFCSPHIGHO2_02_FULL_49_16]|nr:MAG: translation elongation factor Ts [Candidatus Peribacteria bacterium RIFCSPHIGHO2_01_FULL_49_38]OGJ59085.1 MAG: translation elongation factor Ts [Candidatus Peribacteria bacterium RIFCSPHIGHO2_02_FULL_49_16]
MPVSASAVSSLRARTGISILACKEALEQAGGDEEKAIDILKKRGMTQAVKKAGRAQTEGLIFGAQEGNKAAILLLGCETDFVAKEDAFRDAGQKLVNLWLHEGEKKAHGHANEQIPELVNTLGENISLVEAQMVEAPVVGMYIHSHAKIGVLIGLDSGTEKIARDIAMHAAAMNPLYVSPLEAPTDMIQKEKEIWTEQLKQEGKPDTLIGNILEGKTKKLREEHALITQPFAKDPSKKVKDILEGATVVNYVRLSVH